MDSISTTSAAPAETDVFHELGHLTRQLHDALKQLGYVPKLNNTVANLPDARSRLSYIAEKTDEAANKVLNLVDQAKGEQAALLEAVRALPAALGGAAPPEAARLLATVESHAGAIDGQLTDIMMAQDFHDLTGQVVAKVVGLVLELEDSLVQLLVRSAPPERTGLTTHAPLDGPVVSPEGRTDVVASQSEVDDLLASMGF